MSTIAEVAKGMGLKSSKAQADDASFDHVDARYQLLIDIHGKPRKVEPPCHENHEMAF